MIKGLFYAISGVLLLCLVGIFLFAFTNGPGNRYGVSRLQSDIGANLPPGSSKAHAYSWLKERGLNPSAACHEASHKNSDGEFLNYGDPKHEHELHDLVGRKDDTRSQIFCTYAVVVTFAFDNNDRLIRSGVRELSTCL